MAMCEDVRILRQKAKIRQEGLGAGFQCCNECRRFPKYGTANLSSKLRRLSESSRYLEKKVEG
jgi:hypothetical protein